MRVPPFPDHRYGKTSRNDRRNRKIHKLKRAAGWVAPRYSAHARGKTQCPRCDKKQHGECIGGPHCDKTVVRRGRKGRKQALFKDKAQGARPARAAGLSMRASERQLRPSRVAGNRETMFEILALAQQLLQLDSSTALLAISAALSAAATGYLFGARPRCAACPHAACPPSRAVY